MRRQAQSSRGREEPNRVRPVESRSAAGKYEPGGTPRGRPKLRAALHCASPLRGRLMVGRLTLDQVVGVRVPAPQPQKAPRRGFFVADTDNTFTRVRVPRRAHRIVTTRSGAVWRRFRFRGGGRTEFRSRASREARRLPSTGRVGEALSSRDPCEFRHPPSVGAWGVASRDGEAADATGPEATPRRA